MYFEQYSLRARQLTSYLVLIVHWKIIINSPLLPAAFLFRSMWMAKDREWNHTLQECVEVKYVQRIISTSRVLSKQQFLQSQRSSGSHNKPLDLQLARWRYWASSSAHQTGAWRRPMPGPWAPLLPEPSPRRATGSCEVCPEQHWFVLRKYTGLEHGIC